MSVFVKSKKNLSILRNFDIILPLKLRNSRIPREFCAGILDLGILNLGILNLGILEFLGFLGVRGYFLS